MSEAATTTLDLTPKECALIEQMHRTLDQGSHYTLLGVSEDANGQEIRTAYYELSRHWHPDRFFRREVGEYSPKIEAIFSAITQAYQVLSNDRKREHYDRARLEKTVSPGRVSSRRRRRRRSTSSRAQGAPAAPIPAPPSDFEDEVAPVQEQSSAPEELPRPEHHEKAPPRVQRRAPTLSPRARTKFRRKVMQKVRQDVVDNIRRAKIYYEAGKKDLSDGQPLKAESSLYLAVKLDPRNADYRKLLNEAHEASLQIRSQQFLTAAESAESYQNIQEAIYNYRKAAEYQSRDGVVYFRLGLLIRRFEKDTREALKHLRTAVRYTPNNAEFRIALAEVYAELDLALNARREYQEALKLTKDKEVKKRIQEGLRAIR